jgi:transcription antitermination factor NusG
MNAVSGVRVIMEFDDLRLGERWYAVRALARQEIRARAQLENQNFRTFLPLGLKTVRHARKMQTVSAPFFPRYLFVALDLTWQRWRSVNGTIGAAGLVMQGDLPQPVPHGVVETLIGLTDARGLLQFSRDLRVGDRVRIVAGPFFESLAICERLDDGGRVRVLLDIMGGQVPVQMHRDFLIAAK